VAEDYVEESDGTGWRQVSNRFNVFGNDQFHYCVQVRATDDGKAVIAENSSEFAESGEHLMVVKMFDAVGGPDRVERVVFDDAPHVGN
jgi:hypothetical protein